ncbi:unnamed protein product [Ambrosiozyma monospora]|uniref:Unnamed protein product n=1 Tax=Ambrosiozyma monospora TaxID=43982 RepID=A0ACB5TD73_AMBMO|nr:unnamed protein product [Ambrosiozyma monospora]
MLELERHVSNYEPITKCWLFCVVSLPEWHNIIEIEDQDQAQLNQAYETQSTALNSRLVAATRNIKLTPKTDVLKFTQGMLCEQLLRKVNTAPAGKIRELQTSIYFDYQKNIIGRSHYGIHRQAAFHGQLAATIVNFIQSPDQTMEYHYCKWCETPCC